MWINLALLLVAAHAMSPVVLDFDIDSKIDNIAPTIDDHFAKMNFEDFVESERASSQNQAEALTAITPTPADPELNDLLEVGEGMEVEKVESGTQQNVEVEATKKHKRRHHHHHKPAPKPVEASKVAPTPPEITLPSTTTTAPLASAPSTSTPTGTSPQANPSTPSTTTNDPAVASPVMAVASADAPSTPAVPSAPLTSTSVTSATPDVVSAAAIPPVPVSHENTASAPTLVTPAPLSMAPAAEPVPVVAVVSGVSAPEPAISASTAQPLNMPSETVTVSVPQTVSIPSSAPQVIVATPEAPHSAAAAPITPTSIATPLVAPVSVPVPVPGAPETTLSALTTPNSGPADNFAPQAVKMVTENVPNPMPQSSAMPLITTSETPISAVASSDAQTKVNSAAVINESYPSPQTPVVIAETSDKYSQYQTQSDTVFAPTNSIPVITQQEVPVQSTESTPAAASPTTTVSVLQQPVQPAEVPMQYPIEQQVTSTSSQAFAQPAVSQITSTTQTSTSIASPTQDDSKSIDEEPDLEAITPEYLEHRAAQRLEHERAELARVQQMAATSIPITTSTAPVSKPESLLSPAVPPQIMPSIARLGHIVEVAELIGEVKALLAPSLKEDPQALRLHSELGRAQSWLGKHPDVSEIRLQRLQSQLIRLREKILELDPSPVDAAIQPAAVPSNSEAQSFPQERQGASANNIPQQLQAPTFNYLLQPAAVTMDPVSAYVSHALNVAIENELVPTPAPALAPAPAPSTPQMPVARSAPYGYGYMIPQGQVPRPTQFQYRQPVPMQRMNQPQYTQQQVPPQSMVRSTPTPTSVNIQQEPSMPTTTTITHTGSKEPEVCMVECLEGRTPELVNRCSLCSNARSMHCWTGCAVEDESADVEACGSACFHTHHTARRL